MLFVVLVVSLAAFAAFKLKPSWLQRSHHYQAISTNGSPGNGSSGGSSNGSSGQFHAHEAGVSAGWGWQQWGGSSNGSAAHKSQQQQLLRKGSSAEKQLKPWDDNSWSEDGWDELEHGKQSPPSKPPSSGGFRQGSGVTPAHVTGFSPRGGTPASRPRGVTAAAATIGGSNGIQSKMPRQRSDASDGW
jgi:hypothetical protein